MGQIKEIDDKTRQIEWNDLSPLGMFRLGWLVAQEHQDAEVTINCNATIWVSDTKGTTFQLRCKKGQKTLPKAVTVTASRKEKA